LTDSETAGRPRPAVFFAEADTVQHTGELLNR